MDKPYRLLPDALVMNKADAMKACMVLDHIDSLGQQLKDGMGQILHVCPCPPTVSLSSYCVSFRVHSYLDR